MAVRYGRAARTPADFVNLIVSTRRARGLTQAQLAQQAGVSRAWLAAVERGKPHVDFSLMLQTLAALGIRLTAATDTTSEAQTTDTSTTKRSTAASAQDIDAIINRARTRSPK
jgi:transcriptional regulator with XRE-family HTH domain